MNSTLAPDPATESTPPPGPGTKTLSVKNVPHAIWQRARQNALASNLSFGDYVVQLLEVSRPISHAGGTEVKGMHAVPDKGLP